MLTVGDYMQYNDSLSRIIGKLIRGTGKLTANERMFLAFHLGDETLQTDTQLSDEVHRQSVSIGKILIEIKNLDSDEATEYFVKNRHKFTPHVIKYLAEYI